MLPNAFQPHNSHYLGTGYDRGHLTRAKAVSWGPERLATLANYQAFFWTNTAPQHPEMNRRWWAAVEHWEDALLSIYDRGAQRWVCSTVRRAMFVCNRVCESRSLRGGRFELSH